MKVSDQSLAVDGVVVLMKEELCWGCDRESSVSVVVEGLGSEFDDEERKCAFSFS